jgi:hypothetical protein
MIPWAYGTCMFMYVHVCSMQERREERGQLRKREGLDAILLHTYIRLIYVRCISPVFHFFPSLLFAFLALNGRVKGEKEVCCRHRSRYQFISSLHEMHAKAK